MRELSPGIHRTEQISNWLACVLRNSDGRHTIREVVEQLDGEITELEESLREYACVRFLARAHAEGFIEIYRPNERIGSRTPVTYIRAYP